ncbi:hypothetical protein V6N13_117165 [Hibiscus sabdariffa]|uniref:Very-long-chain 3-oxoacyl-CoA synthase n=1 Tax=Hibiscus sabdariffa TaxID=183260 RepID=A0ABR2P9R9_9ROSI
MKIRSNFSVLKRALHTPEARTFKPFLHFRRTPASIAREKKMELPFFPTRFSTVKCFVKKQVFFSTLEDWLANRPNILRFSWGKWPNSSLLSPLPHPVLSYISFTIILSQVSRPSLSRPLLKSIVALHNIFFLALSFIMALGCLVSIFSQVPEFNILVCFPRDTSPSRHLFFWAYIVEFTNTLLIILSGSMERLSFLHVYHARYQLRGACSHVHLLLDVHPGKRPRWNKMVTDFQLLQFWAIFLIMTMFVFYHFTAAGCSGILSWCFNAASILSLLSNNAKVFKGN